MNWLSPVLVLLTVATLAQATVFLGLKQAGGGGAKIALRGFVLTFALLFLGIMFQLAVLGSQAGHPRHPPRPIPTTGP
jgi:hypothetical protein